MAPSSQLRWLALSSSLGVLTCAFAPAFAGQLLGDGKSLLVKEGDRYVVASGGAEVAFVPPAHTEVEAVITLDRKALVSGVTKAKAEGSGETELFLGLAERGGLTPLPAPPGRRAGESRQQAVAEVAAGGELAGVAWLEGTKSTSFRVMSSRWSAVSWGEPEEVAPAGPGSQQALAGATLDDGRAMLVWARFDGADDEIVFALCEGGRWSAPRAIAEDNRVPDIVPTVVAVPGGALAAWSRYDGHDYRVLVAKFDGRAWGAPVEVGGAGSVYPSFHRTTGGARLLFESSAPHGWTVTDLDGSGRALRRASLERDSPERPVLVGDDLRWAGESVRLRWN